MKTIFLHGLGQTAQSWAQIRAQLPALDGEYPELFGGASTYDAVFRDIEQYCLSIRGPVRLCGLSLGAMIALDYAIRHTEQVDSLILMGVQYKVPTLLIDVQNILFHLLPRSAFTGSGLSKEAMIGLTRSMRTLDFSENLQKIHCPVTIVCGQKDFANLNAAKKLQRKLPQAALHIIPGAGHEVNLAAPDAVAGIIRAADPD